MAKLNVPKAFEKTTMAADIRSKLEIFVDYVNQSFDQLFRAFVNQITLNDNIFGKSFSITAMNAQPVTIDIGGATPFGTLILKTDTPIKSYSIAALNTGNSQITFNFDEALSVKSRSVTVSAPFATYDIEALSSVVVGSVVSISGFGNKNNNGSFVVVKRADTLITVYNDSAAAETKSGFTGDRESSKQVSLFVFK